MEGVIGIEVCSRKVKAREWLDRNELTWQVVRETVKKFLSTQLGITVSV
jgi:hypothetical protein